VVGGAGGGPTAALGGLAADAGLGDIGLGDPNAGLFGGFSGPLSGGIGGVDAAALSGAPMAAPGFSGLTGGPDLGVTLTTGDDQFGLPNTSTYGTGVGIAPAPGSVSALANNAADIAFANTPTADQSALNQGLAAIGAGNATPTGTSIGAPASVGTSSGADAAPANAPPSSGVPGVPGPAGTSGDPVDPGIFTGSEVVPGAPPAEDPALPNDPDKVAGQPSIFGPGAPAANTSEFETAFGTPSSTASGGTATDTGDAAGLGGAGGGGGRGRGGRIVGPASPGASGGVELSDGTVVPTGTLNEAVFVLQQAGNVQPTPDQVQAFQQVQAQMVTAVAPQFGGNFQSPEWMAAMQQINQQAAQQVMTAQAA
jgi:hypothetical protein